MSDIISKKYVIILYRDILKGAFNNMKKKEDVKKNKKKQTILDDLSESDDFKLSQRIIDFCLWY